MDSLSLPGSTLFSSELQVLPLEFRISVSPPSSWVSDEVSSDEVFAFFRVRLSGCRKLKTINNKKPKNLINKAYILIRPYFYCNFHENNNRMHSFVLA